MNCFLYFQRILNYLKLNLLILTGPLDAWTARPASASCGQISSRVLSYTSSQVEHSFILELVYYRGDIRTVYNRRSITGICSYCSIIIKVKKVVYNRRMFTIVDCNIWRLEIVCIEIVFIRKLFTIGDCLH